jgi:hypothetical protein
LCPLKAVQSLRIVRTFGTFGANIPVTILKKRPQLMRVEQALPGRPLVVRGLDPSGAWEQIQDKVTKRPAETEVELRELDGDFDGFLVDYRDKGHTVTYAGRETTGGVDCHKISVTLKSGHVRQVFLDARTFLERKEVGTVTLPQVGKVEQVLVFSDYREVDGLMFPFAIDEERAAAGATYAIYTQTIELNPPVDDTIFKMPGT